MDTYRNWALVVMGLVLIAHSVYTLKRRDRPGHERTRSERTEMHVLFALGGLLMLFIQLIVQLLSEIQAWTKSGENPRPLVLICMFSAALLMAGVSGALALLKEAARRYHAVLALLALAVILAVLLVAGSR